MLTITVTAAGVEEITGSASVSGSNPEAVGGVHDNVSATATFFYSTADKNTLIIDLVNTGSKTLDPADVLVGLVFNISGSRLRRRPDKARHHPEPHADGPRDEYAARGRELQFVDEPLHLGRQYRPSPAVSISTSGFSGAFNGNGLGSENDGIAGAGTTLTGGLAASSHQPLALTGLEIKLTFNSDISHATLSNFDFLFGHRRHGYPQDRRSVGILVSSALRAGAGEHGPRRRRTGRNCPDPPSQPPRGLMVDATNDQVSGSEAPAANDPTPF